MPVFMQLIIYNTLGRQAPLLPFQCPNVVGVICGTWSKFYL